MSKRNNGGNNEGASSAICVIVAISMLIPILILMIALLVLVPIVCSTVFEITGDIWTIWETCIICISIVTIALILCVTFYKTKKEIRDAQERIHELKLENAELSKKVQEIQCKGENTLNIRVLPEFCPHLQCPYNQGQKKEPEMQ